MKQASLYRACRAVCEDGSAFAGLTIHMKSGASLEADCDDCVGYKFTYEIQDIYKGDNDEQPDVIHLCDREQYTEADVESIEYIELIEKQEE